MAPPAMSATRPASSELQVSDDILCKTVTVYSTRAVLVKRNVVTSRVGPRQGFLTCSLPSQSQSISSQRWSLHWRWHVAPLRQTWHTITQPLSRYTPRLPRSWKRSLLAQAAVARRRR